MAPLRIILISGLLVAGRVLAESPTGDVGAAMTILRDNCISCHNQEKKKGGLLLTSREAMLKGGEDGIVVVPSNAAKSPLIEALKADAEPHMPPKKQLE